MLGVFFASGAAALLYEVVWMRQLALVFGVTVYATSTVLAIFMGGLALGSFAFGRWIDRRSDPLRVYAVLEVAIGLYALCLPLLFGAVAPAHLWLHELGLPYTAFAFGRALLAACVLLPPTVLMGGTFPVLIRFFVARGDRIGSDAGILYFVNTAGAMTGCLLAGFVLIERLGLVATTHVAAATNFAAALASMAILRAQLPEPAIAPAPPVKSETPYFSVSPGAARLALLCIGVSGFASLAYEVLWTRALGRFLYNSTYAFTTMLATFLAGIALGSALFTAFGGRTRRPLLLFAALQVGVGLGFFGSQLLFANLSEMSSAILREPGLDSFGDSLATMFVRASLILFLPTLFLGASFPLAMALCSSGLTSLGHKLGRVYAVNTLGSIAGSLAIAFLLIPRLGMHGSLTLLVGLNFAMATALAIADQRALRDRLTLAAVAIPIAIGVLLSIPTDLFRRAFLGMGTLVYYDEGATDTVAVIEAGAGRSRRLGIVYEDIRGTAGTHTASWNFFLGHLPMLLHPNPQTVLHICFGVGNSLSAVAAHESALRVDSVELSPHVFETARYFWTNDGVIDNPKVRNIVDDGRSFVAASQDSYDVIVLEPPETFTAGVINLYTREFYESAAARLAPGGVFAQWVLVGQAPLDDERMLLRAFYDVFPEATAWKQPWDSALLLVGVKGSFQIDYTRLRERMGQGRVAQDLEQIPVRDPEHLLSYLVLDPPAFEEFVAGAVPVTDDRTVLDFSMPRYVGSGFGFGIGRGSGFMPTIKQRLRDYLAMRRPVAPYLTNLGGMTPGEVQQRIDAIHAARPEPRPQLTEDEWRAMRAGG